MLLCLDDWKTKKPEVEEGKFTGPLARWGTNMSWIPFAYHLRLKTYRPERKSVPIPRTSLTPTHRGQFPTRFARISSGSTDFSLVIQWAAETFRKYTVTYGAHQPVCVIQG